MTTTDQPTAAPAGAPTHYAYHVREGADKGRWTKVGIAWMHRDEKGINVRLDCVPVDGRISLRVATERDQ